MIKIPQFFSHNKDDGLFTKKFTNGLNSTLHKILTYIDTHPKELFLAGITLGVTLGSTPAFWAGYVIGHLGK